jgi:hypothetical protein
MPKLYQLKVLTEKLFLDFCTKINLQLQLSKPKNKLQIFLGKILKWKISKILFTYTSPSRSLQSNLKKIKMLKMSQNWPLHMENSYHSLIWQTGNGKIIWNLKMILHIFSSIKLMVKSTTAA